MRCAVFRASVWRGIFLSLSLSLSLSLPLTLSLSDAVAMGVVAVRCLLSRVSGSGA